MEGAMKIPVPQNFETQLQVAQIIAERDKLTMKFESKKVTKPGDVAKHVGAHVGRGIDFAKALEHKQQVHAWTTSDKVWAWGEFLAGANAELITEMIGGRPDDFHRWVRSVCAGTETCAYVARERRSSPRLTRLRQRMKCEGLHLGTILRLLGE